MGIQSLLSLNRYFSLFSSLVCQVKFQGKILSCHLRELQLPVRRYFKLLIFLIHASSRMTTLHHWSFCQSPAAKEVSSRQLAVVSSYHCYDKQNLAPVSQTLVIRDKPNFFKKYLEKLFSICILNWRWVSSL